MRLQLLFLLLASSALATSAFPEPSSPQPQPEHALHARAISETNPRHPDYLSPEVLHFAGPRGTPRHAFWTSSEFRRLARPHARSLYYEKAQRRFCEEQYDALLTQEGHPRRRTHAYEGTGRRWHWVALPPPPELEAVCAHLAQHFPYEHVPTLDDFRRLTAEDARRPPYHRLQEARSRGSWLTEREAWRQVNGYPPLPERELFNERQREPTDRPFRRTLKSQVAYSWLQTHHWDRFRDHW